MKNERITPGDLVLIFRKRAVPILLAFVILALAGLGLGMLLPPKYGATATFYVRNMQSEQVLLDYGLTSSQLAVQQSLAKEYAALACESDDFLVAVCEGHALQLTPAQLRGMLSATSDSTAVEITVTAGDAATADAVIAAVTAEYPAFVQAYAWPNLDTDFAVVSLLQAAAPAARVTWHPVWWGLAGGALGILLTYLYFVLAFLFCDRLADADEIGRVLQPGLLLGALPRITPPQEEGEAFFALRERLPRVAAEGGAVVLNVTSADVREGKSTVTVGLARSLAVAGKRVLIVDGDLRREARYDFYQPEAERGLGDLLLGEACAPDTLICQTKHRDVFVLPAGHTTLSPADVPFSERLAATLLTLSSDYDYIFLDLPALSQGPEAAACAADAGGTLLVCAAGKGRASRLRAACAAITEAGGTLLGVIANQPPKSK